MRWLRRAAAVLLVLVWVVVASDGFTDPKAQWLGGLVVAAVAVAGLPLGLALRVHRPFLTDRCAEVLGRRRTAVMLLGSAALLLLILLLGAASKQVGAGPPGAVASVFYVWALVGFTGAARATGSALDPDGGPARRFVVGWVVRSLLLGTPLVWPALLAYQLMTSLGAPVAAGLPARSQDADESEDV